MLRSYEYSPDEPDASAIVQALQQYPVLMSQYPVVIKYPVAQISL